MGRTAVRIARAIPIDEHKHQQNDERQRSDESEQRQRIQNE